MGNGPRPKEILQTTLRFGILGSVSHGNEGTHVSQIGFGLVAQVKSPVKVNQYVHCHLQTFSSQFPKAIVSTSSTYNILFIPPIDAF